MNNILNFLILLWGSGLLSAIAIFVLNWLNSKTKNENIKMFYLWASQAVSWAEVNFDGGRVKKEEAVTFIKQRLEANRLTNNFSQKQIEAVIEWAVSEMKKGQGNKDG